MGLISNLLFFPVAGPARGLLFIVEQLKAQVDDALLGETSRIEDELLNLGMCYEQGELTDEEYIAQEAQLLEKLNQVRREQDEWFEGSETEVEDEGNFIEEENLAREEDNSASDTATYDYGTSTTRYSRSIDERSDSPDDY
ncbi:MAG TPA: gas vesicle protein GvpG [Ktedonobacterales bacterium]|jgi:hypothetical protein